MHEHPRTTLVPRTAGFAISVAAAAALLVAVPQEPAEARDRGAKPSKVWKSVAGDLRAAAKLELKADYLVALARAQTLATEAERDAAREEATEEFRDEKSLPNEQYEARLELAESLGETELYRVDVDPADFVAVIDNPLMPLTPGTTRTYRAVTEDGTETIVVTVTDETKEILGVACTVVRDTVSLDGVLVEDTYDWFAQDAQGNVWYFGELSFEYEDGEISGVDGSWKAGVDGAQPGIVMPAAPQVGRTYRQEFYLGEAEDYASVLALAETVTVPAGTYANCLQTLDATPMEPDTIEHKYYAPGVGVVLEVDVESGERVELISVTTE
jgi:hypothetical protein